MRTEELYQRLNRMRLDQLPAYLTKLDERFYILSKAGETIAKSPTLRRLSHTRNCARLVLYAKLSLWQEGKLKETLSYSDIMDMDEQKKIEELEGQT